MPGFDGSGPFGDGRPGRGMGPCGSSPRLMGRGMRHTGGFGGRKQYRHCRDYVPASTDDRGIYPYDKASLQAEKAQLENELKWVEDQLKRTEED